MALWFTCQITCAILFPPQKFCIENKLLEVNLAIFANKVVINSNFKLVKGISSVD